MYDDEDEEDLEVRARIWETVANATMLKGSLQPHLCFHTRNRRFREKFGITARAMELVWIVLDVSNEGPKGATMVHLLWTMALLKQYGTTNNMASNCSCDEKTFRTWTDIFLQKLSDMDVICWERRKDTMDVGQICFITVDGTDFRIYEPRPFSPRWFSHKMNGPGLRYEVGICIKTGWIVWINGPFPCGEWPDVNIARSSLHEMLDEGEMYVADGGYRDGYQWAMTPNGLHNYAQRTYALARARHETANRRFKSFEAMNQRFRHDLYRHGVFFRSIANVVQLCIMHEEPLFEIEYREHDFERFSSS